MSCEEYAKYVIDNMYRASLPNALNIATSLIGDAKYGVNDFINHLITYVELNIQNNKMDKMDAYRIIVHSKDCLDMYNSEFKYNKNMILDTYIINIWEVLHGYKVAQN